MKLSKTAFIFKGGAAQGNDDGSVSVFAEGQVSEEIFTVDKDTWASIVTHVAKPGHDLSMVHSLAVKLHNGEISDPKLFDLL